MDRNSGYERCFWISLTLFSLVVMPPRTSFAINVVVDYRYDSQNFFNTQQKRDAMQAVADRFSRVITTSLTAFDFADNFDDARIGFTHPGNGQSWEVSPAASAGSDTLADPQNGYAANEYRGPWTLNADDWVLYAGGRSISAAGQGGTGTGLNLTSAFDDPSSHLNRGFHSVPSVADRNLPVWGGAITFDNDGDRTWHFDLDTPAPNGTVDFYSIALHEVGHVLGLSTGWDDWQVWSAGSSFTGPKSVAAYNADNNASLTSLSLQSAGNSHWKDGEHDSFIFPAGEPTLTATVGLNTLQDLLMEPTANFSQSQRRFELTNVDVAALEDVGWSVIEVPVGLPGDYNGNNVVDAGDYNTWLAALGGSTLNNEGVSPGTVDLADYEFWKQRIGNVLSGTGSEVSVPEPQSIALCFVLMSLLLAKRTSPLTGATKQP